MAYSAKAMKFLKENSVVIFLNAPFESIEKRLTNKEVRGIVGFKKRTLKTLHKERQILYRTYKDIEIEMTEDCSIDSVAEIIIQKL